MFAEDLDWGAEKKDWSSRIFDAAKASQSSEDAKACPEDGGKSKRKRKRSRSQHGPHDVAPKSNQTVRYDAEVDGVKKYKKQRATPPSSTEEQLQTATGQTVTGSSKKGESKSKKAKAVTNESVVKERVNSRDKAQDSSSTKQLHATRGETMEESTKVKSKKMKNEIVTTESTTKKSGVPPLKPDKSKKTSKIEVKAKGGLASDVMSGNIPFLNVAMARKKTDGGIKVTSKSNIQAMKDRLEAGRFRFLNEQLYTSSSGQAVQLFSEDPDSFKVYHKGYQTQIAKWPEDPLVWIRGKVESRNAVVADFGCGDARLSAVLPNKTHSFDLVAVNDRITACDMSHVPLAEASVDVAVFCLSLMGTNVADFLLEARRVLKDGGKLLIAEVTSRFKKTQNFTKQVESLGFRLKTMIDSNKMFLLFEFNKTSAKLPARTPDITLMPCIYKKR